MTYEEFSDKLRKIKAGFRIKHGRDIVTLAELESAVDQLLAKPKKRGARSLRGLSL